MTMIADTAHPTATFTATRGELTGGAVLLGAAEIARGVCHAADRRLGLLALTHERMRRIDGWLTDEALVTHPIAPGPDHPVIGTVCARDHADELVGSVIQALVGPVPSSQASRAIDLPAPASLAPRTLPPDVDWLLVVTAVTNSGVDRWIAAAADGGLVGAVVDDVTAGIRLDPVGPIPNWTRIARLLGTAADVHTLVAPTATSPQGAPS
jgi:hypothetical protein